MTAKEAGAIALVTGGGQGIGKGIAKRLLAEGMNVVIADIDGEAAEETAAELGPSCSAVASDVADEPAVAVLMQLVLSRFGRLDALINNAGIADPHVGPVERLELSAWNRIISTNLTGVFLCSKHAVPLLRRSKGAIVNIASTRALQSEAHTEAYSASKGGVVALTHALAVSLGPDIRVNCVSPGWIAVDDWRKSSSRKPPELHLADHAQHPVGRVGIPEDIAAMVSYLISPQSAFVTGQNFVVDGGMTRKMIYVE
ncbi:MAG: glucose 1-dehydrogenase [Geobacter sp.]|nr:MAG: glucose 1-dehydrogenase [Geobacter sp.]